MIFIKDIELVYVAASHSFARLVGRASGDELVGKTDYQLFPPDLALKYTKDDRAILEGGRNVEDYIEPLPDQEGKRSYSSTSKYVLRTAGGRVIGLYGVARDVTAQMQLEAERESSLLTRQMFDDVLEADLSTNRMLCVEGSGWGKMLGISDELLFSETVETLANYFVHPNFAAEFVEYYSMDKLCDDFQNGKDEFAHITYLRTNPEAPEYRWVQCGTRVYHSRVSDTLRITTFLKDVDDEERIKQQLKKEATTDALTGLCNRAAVFEHIEKSLLRGKSGETHALMFIDLDRFKQANDRWGHQFGDKVLQETASRLREVFGDQAYLGRIGGDEFLVFIRSVPSMQAVELKAQQVVSALSFSHDRDCEEMRVTCSVGVALCETGAWTATQLCEHADRAMYRAKDQGRNRFFFCEELG